MTKRLLRPLLLAVVLHSALGENVAEADRKSRSDPDFSQIIDEPNHVEQIGDKVNVSAQWNLKQIKTMSKIPEIFTFY